MAKTWQGLQEITSQRPYLILMGFPLFYSHNKDNKGLIRCALYYWLLYLIMLSKIFPVNISCRSTVSGLQGWDISNLVPTFLFLRGHFNTGENRPWDRRWWYLMSHYMTYYFFPFVSNRKLRFGTVWFYKEILFGRLWILMLVNP